MAKEKYKAALTGALAQFITQPQENTPPAITEAIAAPPKKQTKHNTITAKERTERAERAKANAKYIGTPPAMYKAATDSYNPRGRRVQLLFRPNTHAELLAIAHAQGRSLNNLIENILTDYINRERGE